jgi:hypothetical protein
VVSLLSDSDNYFNNTMRNPRDRNHEMARLLIRMFNLLEKISNRKMALQIERNRENKEQLISFVFGFNLPVTIFYILHYNKRFKTSCKL